MCFEIIYLIYTFYEKDLALNNLQWLFSYEDWGTNKLDVFGLICIKLRHRPLK